MCQETLSVLAIAAAFIGTLTLAVLGVRGVHVHRNGSISLGGSSPPPEDAARRERWAFWRYWGFNLGLPVGMLLILISCVLQGLAIYAEQCPL